MSFTIGFIYICLIIYFIKLSIEMYQDFKVKKVSENYKKLLEINEKYKFEEYKNKFVINHYVKSKKSLDKIDLQDLIIYHIENNIDSISDTIKIIRLNRKKYEDYENEYNKLITLNIEDNVIEEITYKKEKFQKIEKRILKKEKLKIKNDISVIVNASYTSPKGKNNYIKYNKFNFNQVNQLYDEYQKNKKFKISSIIERSKMSDSLRYDVLKRDNYKCQICGASAQDGTKLHVDHIIPISKGGKTQMDNLQTLCEQCNLGKSNKL